MAESWAEMACRDGTPYPDEWRIERALPIGIVFEQIRERVGGPIGINSGYRTLVYNRRIGSKDKSQHPKGRALDLDRPDGITELEFLALALEVARRPGSKLRGIGIYPEFMHIDIRPTDRLHRWRGSRPADLGARVVAV